MISTKLSLFLDNMTTFKDSSSTNFLSLLFLNCSIFLLIKVSELAKTLPKD